MTARNKRPNSDAQDALHALVELRTRRTELVIQANAAWQGGKRKQAQQLARKVVAFRLELTLSQLRLEEEARRAEDEK